MLNSLLNFSDLGIGAVIELISIIVSLVGIISALISAITLYIRNKNKRKFYEALSTPLRIKNDAKNNLEWYHFSNYIKHFFTLEASYLSEEKTKDMPYKKFIKNIKKARVVIITGSAGIGKSLLMQKLALEFRSKLKSNNADPSIEDYNVFFRKIRRQDDINSIFNDFESKSGKYSSNCVMFLDGLDEISELGTKSGSQILTELLTRLDQVLEKCKKIFISLRPEILENGYSVDLPEETDSTVVFKIQNFNPKQVMAMYRRENHRYQDETHKKVIKKDSKARRLNLKKLKSITQTIKDSVFTYPLILTWADDILSSHSLEDLKYISWYDALGIVIDKELEREFELQRDPSVLKKTDTNYPSVKENFLQDAKKFLREIALAMVSPDKGIKRTDFSGNAVVKELKEKYGEDVLFSRLLLRYAEWSERKYEDHQVYYEFLHNTIYWRVLAEALLNPSTLQNVRAAIILNEAKANYSTPLLQYCYEGLWSLHGKKIIFSRPDRPIRDYNDYLRAVRDDKRIACRLIDKDVHLEVILSCFYGFDEVNIDSVRFNTAKIQEFVKERKLNLSYSNTENVIITELDILNHFRDESFDYLDCSSSRVKKAVIPHYVKKINFSKCDSLVGVYITDLSTWCNVEVVHKLFEYAKNLYLNGELVTELIIPDSVLEISDGLFCFCQSIKRVTIPNSVKRIGYGAFYHCSSLEHIVLSEGLTDLSDEIFSNCVSLESITIPHSIKSIGDRSLKGCTNLANITIGNNVERIGQFAFAECKSLTKVVIPDKVLHIGYEAFRGCAAIKTLTIGRSVKKIEADAFAYCTGLTEINFNATACDDLGQDNDSGPKYSLFKNAGENEEGITVTIGTNLTKIPVGLFSTRYDEDVRPKITKILFLENGVCERICAFAFSGCDSLESIILPDSVKSIGSNAFNGCTSLKNIHLGRGLESMVYAFPSCKSLMEISVSKDNKNYKSIDGNLYSYDGQTLFRYAAGKLDTSFEVPEGVRKIGLFAFRQCLLHNIVIPTSVIEMENFAFHHSELLHEIIIPDNVKIIARGAFEGCSSLINVIIPNSVTQIEAWAFQGCTALTTIFIPNSVKSIDCSAFDSCSSLIAINVDENNSYFNSIDGNLYSKDCTELIRYAIGKPESEFTVPTGISKIGHIAFSGCKTLSVVTISEGVTIIGGHAFLDCSSLTNINVPNSVMSIEGYAFCNCSSLQTFLIPKNITRIEKGLFQKCSSLSNLIIPDSIQCIDNAFMGCTSLSQLNIPKSVIYISTTFFSSISYFLNSVSYEGTVQEWNNIEIKGIRFAWTKPISVVCKDGIIKIK